MHANQLKSMEPPLGQSVLVRVQKSAVGHTKQVVSSALRLAAQLRTSGARCRDATAPRSTHCCEGVRVESSRASAS